MEEQYVVKHVLTTFEHSTWTLIVILFLYVTLRSLLKNDNEMLFVVPISTYMAERQVLKMKHIIYLSVLWQGKHGFSFSFLTQNIQMANTKMH